MRTQIGSIANRARTAATAISILAAPVLASTLTQAADMTFVGDLRQIATDSLKGKVALDSLLAKPNTYGLGMLEGLDAELLIIDSKVYLGGFSAHRYQVATKPPGKLVAFGGFATVEKWDAVSIPDEVKNFKQLEAFVGTQATRLGRDPARPMPFKLELTAQSLRWFVVGGMGNLTPTPRDSFVRQLTKGGLDDVAIEAFGFYSTAHRGAYTNPASDMHAHFRVKDANGFVGHLDDDVALSPGGKLFVPKP